jgi:hypothetical protein
MICPECEAEYREGITRCSDCDVALVNELESTVAYDEALTPLADSIDPFTLGDLTDRLEKAGVPYIVEAGTALALLDHPDRQMTAPHDWRARVWIASAFADRAQRIYDEIVDGQRQEKAEHT